MGGYSGPISRELPLAAYTRDSSNHIPRPMDASSSSSNIKMDPDSNLDIATDSGPASTAIPTNTASDDTEDTEDSTDDSDVPPNLAEIHEFIETHPVNEEYDLLDNLPVEEDYIFDKVQAKILNHHLEILFLGEALGVQSWAHLKYTATGESMTFYAYDIDMSEFLIVKDIGLLHLMYPYRVFQDMGYGSRNKQFLVAFIRYIYREARKIDEPLVSSTKIVLVAALKEIAVNYIKQGGALAVPDIERPSRFPSGRKPVAATRPAPLEFSRSSPDLAPPLRKYTEQAQPETSSALQMTAQLPTRSMATLSKSPASLAGCKRPAPEDEDMILSMGQASLAAASPGGRKPPAPKNEGTILSKSPASLAGRKRPAPEEEVTDEDFRLWVKHQKLADQRQALRENRIRLSADKAKIEQEIAQSVADDRLLENHQEHLKAGKPAEWVLVQGIKFGTHPKST